MNEILNQYKSFLEARGKSFCHYNNISLFIKYCEKININYNEINQKTITDFFNENSYMNNTKSNFIRAGRSYDDFLEIPKLQSQWYKIKLIKAERRTPNYLTEKEIEEIVRCLKIYYTKFMSTYKIEALIYFLFYTGVRKAELLNLKRNDLNLEENTGKVFGKGKKERRIYYPDKVKKLLVEYFKSEAETINAFSITKDQLINIPTVLRRHFPNKRIYLHLFRHSFAHLALNKGIDLAKVSKLLGHSDIQTTMIYVDPTEQEIEEKYKEKIK